MTDKLFQMQIEAVPYSSVVGQSLMIYCDDIGAVAQLSIRVPQPNLDYEIIAKAVAKALLSYGTSEGKITVVLPEDFKLAVSRG